MLTLILIELLQLLQLSFVISDCGFPGKSENLILSPEKLQYNEDEEVEFSCSDNNNKLLVFHRNGTVSYSQLRGFYDFDYTDHIISIKRKCKNGSWIGGQPKCVYEDFEQQIIDLDQVKSQQVLKPKILERVKFATLCHTCSDIEQTCMTSTTNLNQKWKFWFDTKQTIALIVLTIRHDPKLDSDQIVVRIKKNEDALEIRTCKIFNVKREYIMKPRFINFIETFNVNVSYSPKSYSDDYPMIELTFICPVKWNILMEKKNPGDSLRTKSIAKYMEVYFKSRSEFERPITMCSWEFMRFPQECGDPDTPLNSRTIILNQNSRVDYKCVENYTLIKNNDGHISWPDKNKLYNYTRRCGVDGDWFDESVSCKPDISCPLYHDINYLETSYKNQTYFNSTLVAIPGTIATFNCTSDYANKGIWNSVCSESGTWVGEDAFCSGQPVNATPLNIIIISLSAVLIIGGLLVALTLFVVIRRYRRLKETHIQDVFYDDVNDGQANEDCDAKYYEPIYYDDLNDANFKKPHEAATYLTLYAPNSSLNDANPIYDDVTYDNKVEYMEMKI